MKQKERDKHLDRQRPEGREGKKQTELREKEAETERQKNKHLDRQRLDGRDTERERH